MITHPLDDLAAYALDALDDAERDAVGEHVGGCASCRAAVAGYRDTLWRLAEDASAPEPAPDLRDRIVARERAGLSWGRRLRELIRVPVPVAVPAALAIALVISVVALGTARSDADAYARALSGVAGAKVIALAPTGQLAGARGSLVTSPSGSAQLVLDVPPTAAGTAWEAWVIKPGSRPVPAGLARGSGVLALSLTIAPAAGDTVAVTLEPASGSPQPTTQPVLAVKAD